MNPYIRFFGWLKYAFLISGMALLLCLGACRKSDETEGGRFDSLTKQFSSLLAAGRYESVDSLLKSERKRSDMDRDSDRWCNTKVQEAVLNYYLCRPDEMLSAIDSACGYLDRRPESPERLMMHHKVLQAKGTVYSQFYFNPDSAIYYLLRGADLADKTGDRKVYALALANVADAYKTNSQLDHASDFYHRAILEADTAGFDPEDYISLYGGLATVYTGLRDFENSGKWWKKTMALWPRMIPFEKFNNLNNLGNDYYYKMDYRGALKTFRRLNNYLDSLPWAEWEKNFVAVNLSDCYLRLGMADSVENLIPRALAYFTDVQPNPVAVSYLHTLMMRRSALKGDYAETDRLIALHPMSDSLRPEMKLLRLEFLSEYYDRRGKEGLALKTWRELDSLEDSLRSLTVAQNIGAQRLSYERDREMLRLQTANARQGSRIMKLLAIIAVVVAILLIIVGAVLINRRRVRVREQQMLDKISSLRAEASRSRITPHFIYNALNHEIRNRNAGLPSRLEAIVSLLRQQQFVASEIVTTLEKELEFTDNYITVQADNFEGRFVYDLNIEEGLDPARMRMPSMLIQILVENAFKHAFPALGPEDLCRLSISVTTSDRKPKSTDQPTEKDVIVSVFNSAPKGTDCLPPRTGTGLRVIMETLKLLKERQNVAITFDINLKHELSDAADSGCLASYTIPLRWMKITTE